MRRIAVVLAVALLASCDFDYPLTSEPTREIDRRLLGTWRGCKDEVCKLEISRIDQFHYSVWYQEDPLHTPYVFVAHHSEVAGMPLISARYVESNKYTIFEWRLSRFGRQLTLRELVPHDDGPIAAAAVTSSAKLAELITANRSNPKLFSNPLLAASTFRKTSSSTITTGSVSASSSAPMEPMPSPWPTTVAAPPPPMPVDVFDDIVPEQPAPSSPEGGPNYAVQTVFYATDRAMSGNPTPAAMFGAERGSRLRFGELRVSIPRNHIPGHLEAPSLLRLEFREDPEKHIVLLSIHPEGKDEFFGSVQSAVGRSEGKDAFVFIHGYNVAFEEAARRTAQLAYDLSFSGAAILYSWPARGSMASYLEDRANNETTVPHLEEFLRELSARTGARTIHLIGHSMGNAALVSALDRLARGPQTAPLHFNQIALTAPDIDADVLTELAGRIRRVADRVTLYVSTTDKALITAESVYKHPRAGQLPLVIPEIDTVDASNLDTSFIGHSPIESTAIGLRDLRTLLLNGLAPGQRGLREMRVSKGIYWVCSPK
jgi:esterase/lipase superfamily enzyme